MRKKIELIFAFLLASVLIFAHQKNSTCLLAYDDSLLFKSWKIVSYEQFSVMNAPTEKQKNDGVLFMSIGTAFLTIDGIERIGTWTIDKSNTWITVSFGEREKYRMKIITLTNKQFVFECQDADLVRTKYYCEPLER